MKAWIATQRSWLVVERFPGYAPDLNPVELVWGNVKNSELANLCPDTIDEAEAAADAALERMGNNNSCASTSSSTPVFLYDQCVIVLAKGH